MFDLFTLHNTISRHQATGIQATSMSSLHPSNGKKLFCLYCK